MPELRFCSRREKKKVDSYLKVLLISANLLACLEHSEASLLRLIISWRAIAVLLQTTQTQVRYLYYLKSAQSVPTQVEHLASDPRLPNLPVRIEVDEEKPGKWQQLVTSKVSQLGKPNSRTMTIFLDVYHREVLIHAL